MESKANGEDFVAAYNRVVKHLRAICKDRSHESYPNLVARASRISNLVRRYRDDLLEYGELRNAIVHDRLSPQEVIAAPRPSVVGQIRRIAELLEKPPTVIPAFSRQVVTVAAGDPLSTPLRIVRDRGYSQFPVYDQSGRFVGLLSERAIARWLAHHAMEAILHLNEVSVQDVLGCKESGQDFAFLPRNATVFDAQEGFAGNPKLEAILITEAGAAGGKLLGIITAWDIVALSQ